MLGKFSTRHVAKYRVAFKSLNSVITVMNQLNMVSNNAILASSWLF